MEKDTLDKKLTKRMHIRNEDDLFIVINDIIHKDELIILNL